jgi:hypothetical protein
LSFGVGAALGSLISWQLLKDKYKVIADEEIAAVKARYSEVYGEEEKKEDAPVTKTENKSENSMKDYAAVLAKTGYTNYSDSPDDSKTPETKKPYYIITAADFDELDDYESEELTYYADGVLADVANDIVEDVEGTVGVESLSSFDEYGVDAVYVRNDVLKTDYEILYDARNYKDIKTPSKPR